MRQENRNDQVVASQVELSVEIVIEYRDGRRVGPFKHVEAAEYLSIRGEDRETATVEVLRDCARELVLRIGRARAESGYRFAPRVRTVPAALAAWTQPCRRKNRPPSLCRTPTWYRVSGRSVP